MRVTSDLDSSAAIKRIKVVEVKGNTNRNYQILSMILLGGFRVYLEERNKIQLQVDVGISRILLRTYHLH